MRSIAEHPPTPTKGAGFGTEFFKIFGAQPKKATTRGALKPATYDARSRDFVISSLTFHQMAKPRNVEAPNPTASPP